MEKEDGNISKDEDIVKHATKYYKELFGPLESPTFSLNPDCWDQNEKITKEENNLLTRQFTEEEIKNVVHLMKRNTAPGPDHMPIEFYQASWEVIKKDMMDMVHEFWTGTGYR
jgi:hypothetical protein